MKLYDGGRAPNPRRVQIFLKEKGVELPTQQLDLNALEHKSDEMLAKNPFATVPFLELEDGEIISETVSICRYIEAQYPDPNLFGEGAKQQAIVDMWNRRVEFGFMLKVGMSFRHLHPGAVVLEGKQVAEWGEKCRDEAYRTMELLDNQLANHQFIAGNDVSIADITGIVAVQFFKPARMSLPETGLDNFRRWVDEMQNRPSVQI